LSQHKTRTTSRSQPAAQFFEAVVKALDRELSKPAEADALGRCASQRTLIRKLNKTRDALHMAGFKRISGRRILKGLSRSGVVHPIEIQRADQSCVSDPFWLIGMGLDDAPVDPIELLRASLPDGVVCYFTALAFHSLTTQLPSHHHIARLVRPSARSRRPPSVSATTGRSRRFHPLGILRFLYQGVPYYETKRDRSLVAGIQQCYLNPHTVFRITDPEQTLLDTLHRPLSCGGPTVVFEAWQIGTESLDEDRLLDHLHAIKDTRLHRRVGCMLEKTGHQPSASLRSFLNDVRDAIRRDDPDGRIPLLYGHQSPHVDRDWLLEIP